MGNESREGLPVGSRCKYNEFGFGALEVEVIENTCDETADHYRLKVLRVIGGLEMPVGYEFDCRRVKGPEGLMVWELGLLADKKEKKVD